MDVPPSRCSGHTESSEAEARLSRWKQTAAKGQDEAFGKLLNWYGLSVDQARTLMEPSYPAEIPNETARWFRFLTSVLTNIQDEPSFAYNQPETPVPFQEIYVPFVEQAIQRARGRLTEEVLEGISQKLWIELARRLLADLSKNSAGVFQEAFQRFRRTRHPELFIEAFFGVRRTAADTADTRQAEPAPANHDYLAFLRHLRAGGLRAIFLDFPAMARLLAEKSLQWAAVTQMWMQRLHDDRDSLGETFFDGKPPGELLDVESGLGDLHEHGQQTLILTFRSGLKIVYKPRDMRIDEAWGRLQRWLDERLQCRMFRPIRTLCRDGYGWAEYISPLPCESPRAAQNYFERAGAMLALTYLLKSTDLHFENIVAHGEYPVIVDIETVLQPVLHEPGEEESGEVGGIRLDDFSYSVLRTALLPHWHKEGTSEARDRGGLSGGRPVTESHAEWVAINTDKMTMAEVKREVPAGANLPRLHGQLLDLADYSDALERGFRFLHGGILRCRDELLDQESGPLRDFEHLPLRVLYRHTNTYARILNASIQPPAFKDGLRRSLEIQMLARAPLFSVTNTAEHPPETWPLFLRECEALERLDIPLFSVHSDSRDLLIDTRLSIPGFFKLSAMEAMREQLARMNEADVELQCRLMRASIHAASPPAVEDMLAALPPLANPVSPKAVDDSFFLHEARRLSREIMHQSLSLQNKRIEWLILKFDPKTEKLTPGIAAYDLYEGKGGILLSLAAIGHATGDEAMLDFCREGTKRLAQEIRGIQAMPPFFPLGGYGGAGSSVYALLCLAKWLNLECALEAAESIATWVTPEVIEQDAMLDVLSGTAGYLLALLALNEVSQDDGWLDKARQAGDSLLNKRTVDEATQRQVWQVPSMGARPLTGFSHGAAGIAWSLVKLSEKLVGGGEPFRDAACEAIEYERAVFLKDLENWPDFRAPSENERHAGKGPDQPAATTCMTSWCHGAAGIGLSRALMHRSLGADPTVEHEIRAATRTTQQHTLHALDHTCCGNFGRIGILNEISQRNGTWVDNEAVRAHAYACVERAHHHGAYALAIPQHGDCPNVALFRGTAGIAYELLRLAKPAEYPCLLALEPPGPPYP